GGPVEILFVDIAKSWELNAWVMDHWFTQLIPGRSLVVQQDYVYFHPYWIHLTMAHLAGAFELVDVVYGASAVFAVKRKIERGETAHWRNLPLPDKLALIERAAGGLPASAAEVLKGSRAYCLVEHGEPARALQLLDTVDDSI